VLGISGIVITIPGGSKTEFMELSGEPMIGLPSELESAQDTKSE